MTVLVMDDASVVRKLLASMLTRVTGVGSVLQADSAATALDLMDRYRPEIAILDIKVPGAGAVRNGIDVLRRIRQTHPATSVIMLTNHATPRYRTECLAAGAHDFFDKSTEFEQLLETVARLSAQHPQNGIG
jgi:two-component system, NarL family, response regulator DevR